MDLDLKIGSVEINGLGKCSNCKKETGFYDSVSRCYVCSYACYETVAKSSSAHDYDVLIENIENKIDENKFGKSLYVFLIKNGYSKSSFAKMTNVSKEDLELMLNNCLRDEIRYKANIEKILNNSTTSIEINDILNCDYDKYIAEKNKLVEKEQQHVQTIKSKIDAMINDKNICKVPLTQEQKEIIITTLESKQRELETHKCAIEYQGNKQWRVNDLNTEIIAIEQIIDIITYI